MYIKKILWATALIGLLIFAYVAYYIYGAMFAPNTAFEKEIAYITIPSDANYLQVRQQLEPLLEDIDKFDALAKQKKYVSYVKPGRYAISKGMSNNDIINSIRSKNIPLMVSFNNQNTLKGLAGRVAEQIEADSLELLSAMSDETFLKENGFTRESAIGMYLPNSYEFFWNSTAEDFRDRMLKEYKRFWTQERLKKAEAIGMTPNEVMTMASIVYEESKQKSEQPRVAGVYVNRIRIGMPLQADPTIKYAAYQLPEYENTIIRRVLNKHMEIDSPYNTYMYRGLPPGPVAMPELSAINAVLNYEKHDYLYFVVDARNVGFHKFAKSLSQHNANAREYHRYLNEQGIRK
ncbi:endolytic transglycosylase MltG [Winogradskyella maritima]|uniref:Endolytic murein transglycosylase n=1 Tax=Winogradskyella maritima TaxID=1517766 RepID=A0ABV8AGT5_9FLAO|nr:endolytic transglycosylase MltG [Winogradskyella maritima]